MKKFMLLLIVPFLSFGQIFYYELINSWSLSEVQEIYENNNLPENAGQINYEVDGYKILYFTPNHNGDMVVCSGAIYLPKGIFCPSPVLSWQHGTAVSDSSVPSKFKGNNKKIGIIAASHGYIVTMSDLIGLGDGLGFHNYVHASTEASSIIDLIEFGKDFAYGKGVDYNEQLFLMGYSQGGHATMAAVKEIEENYNDEMIVTGSVPMAGPYSLSGAQSDMLDLQLPYPNPGYLPYVLFSYQNIYNLFSDLTDVLVSPYSEYLLSMYSGKFSMSEINETLPENPIEIFQPDYYEDYLNNDMHPFKLALIENDVYNFIPQSSMLLLHCSGDDNVAYENAEVAYNHFIDEGAEDVSLVDGGNFNHNDCAQFAIISAKIWIDSLSNICVPENTNINQLSSAINKYLIKKINVLGKDTNQKGFNIEIYDDGSVQKKYVIE